MSRRRRKHFTGVPVHIVRYKNASVAPFLSFHADPARRKSGGHFQQLVPLHRRPLQDYVPPTIDSVQRKYVLGKIDAERYDFHDFPSWASR